MKEFVGKIIAIRFDGQNLKGKMVADYPERIVIAQENLRDKNTLVTSINKAAISAFTVPDARPMAEIEKTAGYASNVPLTVLACQNKGIKCPGVRFVANKFDKDIKQEDYASFMNPCPMKQNTCKCGIIGNISQLQPKSQVALFSGLILGDYPTPAAQPPKQ